MPPLSCAGSASPKPPSPELDGGHDVDRRLLEIGVLTQRQRDVVLDGHRVEQRRTLEAHADLRPQLAPLLRRHGGDLLAVDQDPTRDRLLEADNGPQERGLAGPAAAEDHQDLAAADLEADSVEHPSPAVLDRQVLDLDHDLGGLLCRHHQNR